MKLRPRMHTTYRNRGWFQVVNHLDGRYCPTCKCTVHGEEAQQDHHQHHLDNAEWQALLNDWTEYVAKLGRQVAELCRLLNVEPLENIGEPGEDSSRWRYGITVGGSGEYIPSGDQVE